MAIIEKGIVNVTLNPLQALAIKSIFDEEYNLRDIREVGVFGGFGNGKSFCLMLIAQILATRYPNSKYLFMRTQTTDLEQSVVSQFHDLSPLVIVGMYIESNLKLICIIMGHKYCLEVTT